MKTYKSASADETKKLGEGIGRLLKPGAVVALTGELGAGKTTMVKGIAKGLGVRDENKVSSPTFVLIHEYEGRAKIFHIDWYRLAAVQGADEESALECFERPDAVTIVEWPERAPHLLPESALRVTITHSEKENTREIRVFEQS